MSDNGSPATGGSELEQLCRSCQDFVVRSVGLELDYASETLPLLDHYVVSAREEIQSRPELLPLLARVVGAYFGEVLVRQLDLFWRRPSPDEHGWRVCGKRCFFALNPVGVAYANLTAGAEHSGPSADLNLAEEDRELVEARLLSLPEVSDADFHLFSTRYDVVEIVCAALTEQMRSDGHSDVVFDAADYDDILE